MRYGISVHLCNRGFQLNRVTNTFNFYHFGLDQKKNVHIEGCPLEEVSLYLLVSYFLRLSIVADLWDSSRNDAIVLANNFYKGYLFYFYSQQNMHQKVTLSPIVHHNCCIAQDRILCQPQNGRTTYNQQKYIPDQRNANRFNDFKQRFNSHGRSFELNRDFSSKENLKITIKNPAFNKGYTQKNVKSEPITNRGQGEPNKCNNCETNLYKGQSNGQNWSQKSCKNPKWHSEESHFQQILSHDSENTATTKDNAHKHTLCRSKSFVDYRPQQLLSSISKKASVTYKIDREDHYFGASFKKFDENNKPLKVPEVISRHMKGNMNEKENQTAANQGNVLVKKSSFAKNLDKNKRPLKISEAIALHIEDNLKEKSSLMNPVDILASEIGDRSKKYIFIDNEYNTSLDDIVQQFQALKIPSESNRDFKESKQSLSSKNYRKESISQESSAITIHKKDLKKFNARSHFSETLEFQTKNETVQNMFFEKYSVPSVNTNDRQKLYRSKSSIDFYHNNAYSQRSLNSTNIPGLNKIYLSPQNVKNDEVITASSLNHSNLKERKDYYNVELDLKIEHNNFQQQLSNPREVNQSTMKYSAQERLLALKSKSSDSNKLSTPPICTENTPLMQKLNVNSNTQKCQLTSFATKQIEAPRISSRVQQRLLLHTFRN